MSDSRQGGIGRDSTRRQLEMTRAYCERKGLVLDDSLRLADIGVSAFRGKNAVTGKLGAFLNEVEAGRVAPGSVLLVESIDRLSRAAVLDALTLFTRILAAGITVVTLQPEREYTRDSVNDLAGLLEPLVYMSRANEESQTKSHRIKQSWDRKRRQAADGKALGGSVPWWLEFQDGAYIAIKERVEVVRLMYRMRADGKGSTHILKVLNAGSVKSPRGGTWSDSTVNHILRSRTVIGERQHHKLVDGIRVPEGEPVAGYYPAIIDLDLFHRVQSSKPKKGRDTRKDAINIFKGLIFNAEDGQPFYSMENVVKGKYVYRKLQSAGKYNKVPGASGASLDYFAFERGFLNAVRELDPADFAGQDHSAVADEVARVSGKLAEVEHQVKTVKQRYRDGGGDALLDLLNDLDADRKVLAAQLATLNDRMSDHRSEALGELRSLVTMLSEGDDAGDLRGRIRARIATLVERINVRVHPLSRGWAREHGMGARRCYLAATQVTFRNGSRRVYVIDHDGIVRTPSFLTDQAGNLDRYDPSDFAQ